MNSLKKRNIGMIKIESCNFEKLNFRENNKKTSMKARDEYFIFMDPA